MSRAVRTAATPRSPTTRCRNRHCPKCQGAAARDWLAEREAELLPVPYFHVVFTLPAAIADIAYQNKAVIYDLLFKASSETLLTIAADPEASRRADRHHRGAAHLGLGDDPSSARAHDRAGRRASRSTARAGSRCKPGFFLPVRVLSKLFRRLMLEKLAAAHAAGKLQFFGEHAPSRRRRCLRRLPRAAQDDEVVRLRQEALRRAAGGARLSRALHPPRRRSPTAG